MTYPDEALLYAREQMADDLQRNDGSAEDVAAARAGAFDTLLKVAAAFYRAGAAASADRIKELEAENADLQDLAGRLRVEMSDMLTRLKERHPEDFVWLKDGDEPTDEDRYGWGGQG